MKVLTTFHKHKESEHEFSRVQFDLTHIQFLQSSTAQMKIHGLLELLIMLMLFGITIVTLIYYFLIRNYNYWSKRKVAGPEPSLIFGNTKKPALLKTTIAESLNEIYQAYKDLPYVGIYELRTPVLLLRDPTVIKSVLVKDFSHFQGRGIVMNENTDPLCANLINLTGSRWRNLRSKLTPAFTSGKIRKMFQLIAESSDKYKEFIAEYADNEETVEFRDLAAKFTTDVISTCCFGLQTNSIQNEDSEFRAMCRRVLDPSLVISLKRIVRWYMPWIFKQFKMSLNPNEVTDYFLRVVRDMIRHRENNNFIRNDMMQLLMQLKNEGKLNKDEECDEQEEEEETNNNDDSQKKNQNMDIDEKVIAAQAYIFFLAGFETSSTTMSFTMYELAANPGIQQRVSEEIRNVLNKHGSMSYEAILEMEYLDRVIRETMRKHPPVGVVPRICNKAYEIPETGLVIEEGIKVLVPIHAIHHDPDFYPNPSKFDPDRFLDENRKLRDNCTFLPFGEGPRICIGSRFAYAQTKAGLIALLQDYEVLLSGDRKKSHLEYDPTANILTSKTGIWLKIRRRN